MREIGSGNVLVEIDEHRADIVLNRPEKRNAMNEAPLTDLKQAITEVDSDESVRAITLLGEGPVFCAGMDLEMMRDRGEQAQKRESRSTGSQEIYSGMSSTQSKRLASQPSLGSNEPRPPARSNCPSRGLPDHLGRCTVRRYRGETRYVPARWRDTAAPSHDRTGKSERTGPQRGVHRP